MIPHRRLMEIVGPGNVSRRPGVLQEYSRSMSASDGMRADCVVRPGSADQVAKLVNLARRTSTPLVPVSSGPPHFHGSVAPSTGGALIVDLSGMKKVIRVDRMNRVAMFEPGVTFGELIPAVQSQGLRLNMPLTPRKTKSVVASLLEREPVTMPAYHWDAADPLNCVEIIFGTGDMFRTGAAAGPGTIEEQWAAGGAQVEAAGPSSASWYRVIQGAQGTMGIVTWASARCEILPKLEQALLVGWMELDRILELAHWLVRLRLANECLVMNGCNLAAMMAKTGADDYHDLNDALPRWVLFFNVAGYDYLPEERVRGQVLDAVDIAQRVGVEPVPAVGGVSASELLKIVRQPSEEPYWKLRYKGACRDILFLTNYDGLPGLIEIMHDVAEAYGYPVSDLGTYIQPLVQGSNYHCEFNLFYDPANPLDVDRVRELAAAATRVLMDGGAFFSRPYGESARMIVNRDAATVAALKKIKTIVDPDGIMNPGKLCF